MFVSSPPDQFRHLDKGGRTATERSFIRAVYYLVRKVPEHHGRRPDWSVFIGWGRIEKRGSRWGRVAIVRVVRYSAGRRYAAALPGSQRWSVPGQVAPAQSLPDTRIDE